MVTVLRQELFRADNKRVKIEQKMKEARQVYQSMAKEKEFYIQKISEQR